MITVRTAEVMVCLQLFHSPPSINNDSLKRTPRCQRLSMGDIKTRQSPFIGVGWVSVEPQHYDERYQMLLFGLAVVENSPSFLPQLRDVAPVRAHARGLLRTDVSARACVEPRAPKKGGLALFVWLAIV